MTKKQEITANWLFYIIGGIGALDLLLKLMTNGDFHLIRSIIRKIFE